MTYTIKTDLIYRSELDKLVNFFDKILPKEFDEESIVFGGYDVADCKWEGKYEFIYQTKTEFVKGDFKRNSKDTYKGNLLININPELEKIIIENIVKIAPSIKKKIQNSKTESFSKSS